MTAGRTVLVLVWLSVVGLLGLVACALLHAPELYTSLCILLGTLAGAQAGKSTVEAVATGTGLQGVKAAILTYAKPGEPPP